MKVIQTRFSRGQFCAARICLFAVLVGIWAVGKFNVSAADSLEKGFLSPPAAAKPQVWWQWMNGHVTREGITRDLEAMKSAGLGGFTLFNTSEGTPAVGPVAYMSDEWWKLFQHTLVEADRLGLEMGLQNSAGWSASGGPWVTPEQAMQEVVWTEKRVTGPAGFDGVLEIPEPALGIERDMMRDAEINKRYYVPREHVRGCYRDIALWAFPTPKSDQGQKPFRLDNWKAKAGFSKLKGDYAADSRPAAPAIAAGHRSRAWT
jgi:alpha-L-rhamnosidase